jgi:hypothetical protein
MTDNTIAKRKRQTMMDKALHRYGFRLPLWYPQTFLSIINTYAGFSHTISSLWNEFVPNTPRQGWNDVSNALIVMSRYSQAIIRKHENIYVDDKNML